MQLKHQLLSQRNVLWRVFLVILVGWHPNAKTYLSMVNYSSIALCPCPFDKEVSAKNCGTGSIIVFFKGAINCNCN